MGFGAPDMDAKLFARAVAYARKELSPDFFVGLREAHSRDPKTWWAQDGWHFQQGMGMRNLLRDVVADRELPTGNWDDYYVEVLEAAAGLGQPSLPEPSGITPVTIPMGLLPPLPPVGRWLRSLFERWRRR